jgi:hypothetical protein
MAGFSLQIPVILAIPFDRQEERWLPFHVNLHS